MTLKIQMKITKKITNRPIFHILKCVFTDFQLCVNLILHAESDFKLIITNYVPVLFHSELQILSKVYIFKNLMSRSNNMDLNFNNICSSKLNKVRTWLAIISIKSAFYTKITHSRKLVKTHLIMENLQNLWFFYLYFQGHYHVKTIKLLLDPQYIHYRLLLLQISTWSGILSERKLIL